MKIRFQQKMRIQIQRKTQQRALKQDGSNKRGSGFKEEKVQQGQQGSKRKRSEGENLKDGNPKNEDQKVHSHYQCYICGASHLFAVKKIDILYAHNKTCNLFSMVYYCA